MEQNFVKRFPKSNIDDSLSVAQRFNRVESISVDLYLTLLSVDFS
jgi:hypothetical protein